MDRGKVREALLRFIWLEIPSAAPGYADEDVANAVNAAFQTIWSAPLDYYRRRSTTLDTVASTPSYSLTPGEIQEVLTPVKIGAKHLRPIAHRSDLDHFHTRFAGGSQDPTAEGEPVAFYVERTNNSGNDDLSAVSLHFTPVPDAAYTVSYDYVAEAPSYTSAQMQDAEPLEFPHGYVESIFLPVARFHMMNSHFFHNEADRDRSAYAKEEYAAALLRLGFADPQAAEVSVGKEVSR